MAPTVFLSSTIQDLGDLRSATRFYLEQFGFTVFTSETPDFPHDLDTETRRAALRPIAESDYYVLLLGYRTGTMTPDGLSVTRSEYRYARDLHRDHGRPQIVLLGRDEVLSAARRPQPESHRDLDNWAHLVDFVNEVGTADPRDSNWLHPFGSFRDVSDVLRTALRLRGPLPRLALEANLYEELVSNTRQLLARLKPDFILPVHEIVTASHVPPPTQTEAMLDRHGTFRVWAFRLALPGPQALATVALSDAISSGEFLEFDAATGRMGLSDVQRAMLMLRERVARYEWLFALLTTDANTRTMYELARSHNTGLREASLELRTLLYSVRDELDNVSRFTRALLRSFAGVDGSLMAPELNPPTPLPEEAERIAAEVVSREAALAWALAVEP